jgi:hypothetical protein
VLLSSPLGKKMGKKSTENGKKEVKLPLMPIACTCVWKMARKSIKNTLVIKNQFRACRSPDTRQNSVVSLLHTWRN